MLESNPNKLLTPEQAAELLQVSTRTMYDWLRNGQVPGVQIGGKLWRIREGDILSQDARGLVEQGRICDMNFEVGAGAAFFRKALELNPHYNLANFYLGEMYYRWGFYWDAEAPLKKAIELNPEWAAPYGTLGLNYNHANRFEEAETVLKQCIELVPSFADVYYQLGYALLQQSIKDKEAEAAFKKAVELNPKHVMAFSFLGDVLIRQRNLAEAEWVYDQLKEINDSHAQAHLRQLEWAKRQYSSHR
jgi:excisionase family DNA binding protein